MSRSFQFADVIECVVDRVPDNVALSVNGQRFTYRELEDRANRLAHHFASLGVGHGDWIACYVDNHPDHAIALFAAFKLGAVPINVNFRYSATELAALLDDARPAAVLFDPATRSTVDAALAAAALPATPALVAVGPELDAALAAAPADRPAPGARSPEDLYVIYTGGTTGHPKGVVWRQEDAFFTCLGGCDMTRLEGFVETPEQIPSRILSWSLALFPVAPLMHAAAQWQVLACWTVGAKAVLQRGPLDPAAVWRMVEEEQVNSLVVVGDAVGGPVLDAYLARAEAGDPPDVSSLLSIGSGGAPLSPALRRRIAAALPNVLIINGYGSSETGTQAVSRTPAAEATGELASGLAPLGDVRVIDDDGNVVAPGSGLVGRLVAGGRLPLRYHNDPERTSASLVELEGRRWFVTGDHASIEADGTVTLRGRGSACINTGGEKVFVEEVEGALIGHPAVADVVVVGVPDERWGAAVTAVVKPVPGQAITLDDLREHGRQTLAGYKLPKHLVVVDEIRRSPAGKADYRWAADAAAAGVTG